MGLFRRTKYILGLIVGFCLIHFYLPRLIVEIKNPVLYVVNKKIFRKVPGNASIVSDTFRFKSFDSIQLSAYYVKADSSLGTVILLHGIRSNKNQMMALSHWLKRRHYSSVALDLRGHNMSEGRFCTFGVKEKYDVRALVDYISKMQKDKGPYAIMGTSLGAAVALQTMELDERICCGIIQSTFSDYRTIVHQYFKNYFGFSFRPFSNYLATRGASTAGFNAREASPLRSCKNIHTPVLFVHGDADQNIPVKYNLQNFQSTQSKNKTFYLVKGAGHNDIAEKGGDPYFDKVLLFLDTFLK